MHNQSDGPIFITAQADDRAGDAGRSITLGQVFARHWEVISGFLHKLD